MKFFRSTLFVTATAIVAAACGDKVTVAGPTTTAPKVNSVSVSPATATLNVGDKITMTAAVNADAGVVTTVTWSSSGAAATVDAGGIVTAVSASPGIAICATSTVNTSVKGCGSVVITPATVQVPASVSIASITGALGLNNPVPVPPGVVAGQIDVRVNVTPGTVKLDSIVVFVNGKSAGSQGFTAADAAALRSAADLAVAQQTTVPTVVISINTAAFNATTGAVKWLNGPAAITASAYGKQGGTATPAVAASQSVNLLFGNVNGFIGTTVVGGAGSATQTNTAASSATDAAGYLWKSGNITVSAIPVIYTGQTVLNATVRFGGIGCSASGVSTLAMTAPVAPSAAWTATFSNTATAGATNVTAYEFNPAALGTCATALVGGGEAPAISAVGSDNDQIVLIGGGVVGGAGFLNAPVNLNADPNLTVRLDNVAPAAFAAVAGLAINGRTNGWLNDAVVLNKVINGSQSNNGAVAAAADLGVGRLGVTGGDIIIEARASAAGDGATATDATAPITSVAALAETATGGDFRLRLLEKDKLGNFTKAASVFFGVDRTAPVLTLSNASTLSNAGFAAMPAGYSFSAQDNSVAPAAPSGFFSLATTPLSTSLSRRENTIGTRYYCSGSNTWVSSATIDASGCTTIPAGSRSFAGSMVQAIDPQVLNLDAYYSMSATVADQAGNVSASVSNVLVLDATAPTVGGVSFPASLTGNSTTVFTAPAADNLDIAAARITVLGAGFSTGVPVGYTCTPGGAACNTFRYPSQTVNAFNAATLITSTTSSFSVANFTLGYQFTAVAGANTVLTVNSAMSASMFALNQAGTASPAAVGVFGGALTPPAVISNAGAAGTISFALATTDATTPAFPAALSRDGNTAAIPTVTGFSATAKGLTGAGYANPFSVVQFWAFGDGGAGVGTQTWRLIGTANAASVSDDNTNRFWTYTMNWDPSSATATTSGNYYVIAIGIAPTGNGLVSNSSTAIVMNP